MIDLSTTPHKRQRRTKAEMETVREGLYKILADSPMPLTVRQVFYRAVVAYLVDKTEAAYKSTVCRLLTEMRKDGTIPYTWLTDATRWMRKPRTWHSTESYLAAQARDFRRDVWNEQDVHVEVWCESGSLAGVLWSVTKEWDVPLHPCNGYPSLSFLHGAGSELRDEVRPVFIYYVGDWDPAGVNIPQKVEAAIREFAPDVDLHFERLAVTAQQIAEWKLPTRPPKEKDSRRKNWIGECVEAEAIEPDKLCTIVNNSIVQHIDNETYERVMREEHATRETLAMLARNGLPMTRPTPTRKS